MLTLKSAWSSEMNHDIEVQMVGKDCHSGQTKKK